MKKLPELGAFSILESHKWYFIKINIYIKHKKNDFRKENLD